MREFKQYEQAYEREVDKRVTESMEFMLVQDKGIIQVISTYSQLREVIRLIRFGESESQDEEYLITMIEPATAVVFAMGIRAERMFSEKTSKIYTLLMRQIETGKQGLTKRLDLLSAVYAICYRTLYGMYTKCTEHQMKVSGYAKSDIESKEVINDDTADADKDYNDDRVLDIKDNDHEKEYNVCNDPNSGDCSGGDDGDVDGDDNCYVEVQVKVEVDDNGDNDGDIDDTEDNFDDKDDINDEVDNNSADDGDIGDNIGDAEEKYIIEAKYTKNPKEELKARIKVNGSCYCCGFNGHWKFECKHRNKICTICDKVGHSKATCWRKFVQCYCCGMVGHIKN